MFRVIIMSYRGGIYWMSKLEPSYRLDEITAMDPLQPREFIIYDGSN